MFCLAGLGSAGLMFGHDDLKDSTILRFSIFSVCEYAEPLIHLATCTSGYDPQFFLKEFLENLEKRQPGRSGICATYTAFSPSQCNFKSVARLQV